jgi:hypothetical protein
MRNLQFPESFVNVVSMFQKNFSKPSFEYFNILLSAILLGQPRKTVTAGLRLLNPKGHFSNACRFLSHYVWDAAGLGLSVLTMAINSFGMKAPFLFALDDTLVAKYGPKIFGRGLHFNHTGKPNEPRYINGHNWVVLGLLHFSTLFSKWICLPILADLFVPELVLPKGKEFKSRTRLAIDLLRKLKNHVKGELTIVADGLYAKTSLVNFCLSEGITFISRLRSDAALYQSAQDATGRRRRGRPRKYGKRLPKLEQMAKNKEHFKKYNLTLYGESHQLYIKSFEALWKPAGQFIKVLMVYFDGAKTASYFFSTDLSLSDTQIIQWVAARFSIEIVFGDLKEHLGLTDWQCRVQKAVVRSVPLTCVATTLLVLWSYGQSHRKQLGLWNKYAWYSNKASPSIHDMVQQLKAECISKTIFQALPQKAISKQKYHQIELFLRAAA